MDVARERISQGAIQIEPEILICDPHHHLWDYPESRYLVDELMEDVGGARAYQPCE